MIRLSTLALIGVVMVGTASVRAQVSDDAVALRLKRLEDEVKELSALLRAALPPSPITPVAPTVLRPNAKRVKGLTSARVAIVEFSDFECPFCGRHATGTFGEIHKKFVESGQVQYVFHHLPIEQLHPHANKAAEAAECAAEQGKFWEFHDRLFANQKALALADLTAHAKALGLNIDACMMNGKMAAKVAADLAEARTFGLTQTPVFLIGQLQKDGSVTATRKVVGAQPFEVFDAVITELLDNK